MLEVISLLRGKTNRSITSSAIIGMERAEPLLEGKMADGLNVISTSSLSSPQQITVFALYTVAVSTHSLLLSTGKIRIRMREMRMKTLLLLHPWTSKLWLVPESIILHQINH